MSVPTLITQLSTTAANNFPAGTDSPALLDDVQRAHASFIAQLRDGAGFTGAGGVLPIAGGGTGSATAAAARTALGSTATGDAVFIAANAGAARTALGSTATGDAVFIAANAGAARTALGAAALGANNFTAAQNHARATVASAASADIWSAAGNQIDWTGTATATGFAAAPQAGAERVLICAGACAFTAGANMLIDGVASGVTVTCAANDKIIVLAVSTTQFHLTRQRFNGFPLAMLGTVSQASGVPTGAIIERGSNANGEYVRFADGTQICYLRGVSVTTTTAKVWMNVNVTLPAAFVDVGYTVSASMHGVPSNQIIVTAGTASSATSAQISAVSESAVTVTVQALAIGRWF